MEILTTKQLGKKQNVADCRGIQTKSKCANLWPHTLTGCRLVHWYLPSCDVSKNYWCYKYINHFHILFLQYGPVFSFTMVGKTFTYLIGSESAALFFNSRNENLNAEDVYSRLTTPVFGKGVAYDCPNSVSLLVFCTRLEFGDCCHKPYYYMSAVHNSYREHVCCTLKL